MMSKKMSNAILEVDETIIENNLKIELKHDEGALLAKILNPDTIPDPPIKEVLPVAGLCVKTTSIGPSPKKIFFNLCTMDFVPSPKDISSEELKAIWSSDKPDSYKLPMSIGPKREETDKQGRVCHVYDIAVNPSFFNKVEEDFNFRSFLVHVIFEALETKYREDVSIFNGYVILKHRKAMGVIKPQKIQIGYGCDEFESYGMKPTAPKRNSCYRLNKVETDKGLQLHAEFFIHNIAKADISLSLGEDRIRLYASAIDYLVDIFIPYKIDTNKAVSTIDCTIDMMNLTVPITGLAT